MAEIDEAVLRKIFNEFDADGSGKVDKDECKQMAMSMGLMYSEAELVALIKEADVNGDGEIDFEEFTAIVKSSVANGKADGFGGLALRKKNSGPPMKWREDRFGPGMEVKGDICRRAAGKSKWGVQLIDAVCSSATWDMSSILFEVKTISDMCYIGLVNSNYNKSQWDDSLNMSSHAVAVRTADGAVFRKGSNLGNVCKLCQVKAGQFVHLEFDMLDQSLKMQILSSDSAIVRQVSVTDIPAEVCVAIAFGEAEEEQAIRIVGSSTQKTGRKKAVTIGADTWDDSNVQSITPSNLRRNSMEDIAASLM